MADEQRVVLHTVGGKWSSVKQIRGGTRKGRGGERRNDSRGPMAPLLKRRDAPLAAAAERRPSHAELNSRSVRALSVSRSVVLYKISLPYPAKDSLGSI